MIWGTTTTGEALIKTIRREYTVKFLSEHFMKYVISQQFHYVNYQEMLMISFLKPFMKYKNSENRFSGFSLS